MESEIRYAPCTPVRRYPLFVHFFSVELPAQGRITIDCDNEIRKKVMFLDLDCGLGMKAPRLQAVLISLNILDESLKTNEHI